MSSSDSDEDISLRYGTPLEPYEEDAVPTKRRAQQASEQYAVDAHGRRRFHGAFTGGFSAGHGNSVDTPEGWAPATFKSSRSDRGTVKTAAPEDFMDEEDRSEFGIAPRLIQTQSDFVGQKRPHPSKRYHDGPIPGEPILEQFIRTVPETAAVRLLRGMGWRASRGVGEQLPAAKKYGCYVPPEFRQNKEDGSDSDEDLQLQDYNSLFNSEPDTFLETRKNDRFGLGYTPLSRHSVLGGMSGEYGGEKAISHLKMNEKGKKVSIRGQAFGVGALEDDDEDVYAREDMTHYDFAIGGPSRADAPRKDKSKSEGLEGFVQSTQPLPSAPSYPPPALPRDYRPAPAGFRATRFDKPDTESHVKLGLGRHELSAEDRGAFLGEPTDSPSKTTNPVSTRTEPDDLIAKIVGRNVSFVSTTNENASDNSTNTNVSVTGGTANITDTNVTVNVTDSTTNIAPNIISVNLTLGLKPNVKADRDSTQEYDAGERVFMPFASDTAKQARYERFLRGEQRIEDGEGRVAEWEAAREVAEFEQARKLYRPLTGVLKDRFTGSSGEESRTKTDENSGLSDQMSAARRGMYGALTRTRAEWRPDSLVCKRFNVPDPFSLRPDKKPDKQRTNYSIFEYLEGSVHSKESFTKDQGQFSGSKSLLQANKPTAFAVKNTPVPVVRTVSTPVPPLEPQDMIRGNKRMTVAELFLMEAEKERLKVTQNETGEVTRTIDKFDKMELYNSIFMSDSEDEATDKTDKTDNDFKDTPVNAERNTSPPRGIFANLDFDKLNSRPSKNTPAVEKPKEDVSKVVQQDKNEKVVFPDEVVELYVSSTGGVLRNAPKNSTPEKAKIPLIDIEDLFTSPGVDESSVYGPKIPENLKKQIENKAKEHVPILYGNTSVSTTAYKEMDIEDVLLNNNTKERLKPVYRDKKEREKDEVVEVDSSSDADSWVAVHPSKSKKEKKKKKDKKHKSKKKKKDKYK